MRRSVELRQLDGPAFRRRLLGGQGDLEGEEALGPGDRRSTLAVNGVEESAGRDLIEIIAE
jgi:hypothetical protein